jgi:3',5'-cyclic-AMP phosphodiesterase
MLRLLQFTDTHLFADPRGELRGTQTLPSLRACLGHARRRHMPADLVAVTGDLVQDEPEAYGVLELVLADVEAPVLLIPGNHDVPSELRRHFPAPRFQTGGTRVIGSWAVILLDTSFEVSGRGEGRLGPAALHALDADLARHESSHVLVCLHHPPVAMEAAGLDALGLGDAEAFLATVDAHPNVRGVAWGHAHQSLDLHRGAVRFMCTPATCMQFEPRNPGFVIADRPPGYRVIDLHDDGGIATEVVWLEGYVR